MFPAFLVPERPLGVSPQLEHPQWQVAALLIVLGALLVGSLLTYLVLAIKRRGKPQPERLGHGNLQGYGPGGGRGTAAGGPVNSGPGAFALYGRKDPYAAPQSDEDPRRR